MADNSSRKSEGTPALRPYKVGVGGKLTPAKEKGPDTLYPEWNEECQVWRLRDTETGQYLDSPTAPLDTFVYTPMAGRMVCKRIMEGETLSSICRDESMPSIGVIYYWRRRHPDFDEAIQYARKARAEIMHDKVVEISDELREGGLSRTDMESKARAADGYKWSASKSDRAVYGDDKVPQESGGPAVVVFNTGVTGRPPVDVKEVVGGELVQDEGGASDEGGVADGVP